MFALTIAITVAGALFLIIRDRIKYPRFTSKIVKQTLQTIQKQILFQDWEGAEKNLQILHKKKHFEKEILLLELKVLRGTRLLKEALELVTIISRQFPEELLFRLEEARILLDLNNPEEALNCFKVCLPILRDELDFFDYGQALFETGHIEECCQVLEEWAYHSAHPRLIALMGDCYFHLKDFPSSIFYYEKALKIGGPFHEWMTRLGTAYRKHGNLSQAEQIFRSILEKDGQDLTALMGLGACLQERGQYHKALLTYQTSPCWYLQDPRLLLQAGYCALRTQKFSYAESYFTPLLIQEKPSAQVLFYYAYSLEGQQKWQAAENTYLALVHHYPNDPNGYRALAWLYGVGLSAQISADEGIHYAHIALKIAPDSLSLEILSACEARRGNFEKAHQIQESLFYREVDREKRGRYQQAMRLLRKNLPLDDNQVLRSLVA